MDVKRVVPASRLFAASLLECKDELEDRYERCYLALQQIIGGKGDKVRKRSTILSKID